jgi:hypothetical protein
MNNRTPNSPFTVESSHSKLCECVSGRDCVSVCACHNTRGTSLHVFRVLWAISKAVRADIVGIGVDSGVGQGGNLVYRVGSCRNWCNRHRKGQQIK